MVIRPEDIIKKYNKKRGLKGDNMNMTRKQREEKITREAIEVFKNHEIIKEKSTEDRWLIASRYEDGAICGTHATEIISLYNGRLFVRGDIPDCVFGYHGGRDPVGKVYWIGRQSLWTAKQVIA